jgi:hypothetical protein
VETPIARAALMFVNKPRNKPVVKQLAATN